MRSLMSCIAYSEQSPQEHRLCDTVSDLESLSSSTSDLTNVSSLSDNLNINHKARLNHPRSRKNIRQVQIAAASTKKVGVKRRSERQSPELQVLCAALGALKMTPTVDRHAARKPVTFSQQQIARENVTLLGRLQRTRTRPAHFACNVPNNHFPQEASAAINRRQEHRKIQRENMILLRKITAARGSTNKRSKWTSSMSLEK